jgi:ornithine carbamoyltransferase
MSQHVLKIADLSADEIIEVLDRAESPQHPVLAGRGAALLFEHPSARTRNASEMAVFELGGHPVTIRGEEVGLDVRESTEDVARTLACYHALIGARVAKHTTLERMVAALDAAGSETLVINLLSNVEHPTQALADLLTIRQRTGGLEGRSVCFVGDANNVCRSLVMALALVGAEARVASPAGYELSEADLAAARALGGAVATFSSATDAAKGADVLYTDVWISMGEESQAQAKRAAFAGFAIDEALVSAAAPDALVLHCLPAHRGEEVSAAVIDGPQSGIWLQAENRLHALRGLLSLLFSDRAV